MHRSRAHLTGIRCSNLLFGHLTLSFHISVWITQRDLSVAELDLVTAMTICEKARVELDRAIGATLEHNGVLIQDAITGTVTALSPQLMPSSAKPEDPCSVALQESNELLYTRSISEANSECWRHVTEAVGAGSDLDNSSSHRSRGRK